jgi:hypothetical protein
MQGLALLLYSGLCKALQLTQDLGKDINQWTVFSENLKQ